MTDSNPRSTLSIVLCGSLIIYGAVAILLLPLIAPTIIVRDDLVIAILQGALVYLVLFLLFLLPASYVYWSHRIDVKVLGPELGVAEPGEELKLTVVVGFPKNEPPKNAVLEAFLGALNIATQKLESSPTELHLRIPDVSSGYHNITIQVTRDGYFKGIGSYELLIAASDQIEYQEEA
ncbi:MAG: hypothetical protein ACFE9D_09740 [Promethearchaeota archaeon]